MHTHNFNIEKLKEVLKVQKQRRNLKKDRYMDGFYNGLELALSIIEEREPVFERGEEYDSWIWYDRNTKAK